MMGRKQKLKSGDEWDTVSRRGRRIILSFKKSKYAKRIKQKMNRRARKEARAMEGLTT
jgi:hypothetical protein